jgi:hypothetical protein
MKKKSGGSRPGAGRPTLNIESKNITFRCPVIWIAQVKKAVRDKKKELAGKPVKPLDEAREYLQAAFPESHISDSLLINLKNLL